jgi:hypothetical protein
MSPLPIVFIHRGASRYLAGSITQARQSNPDAQIFVLGDRYNAGIRLARHFKAADFSDGAREFRKVYKHLSTHDVEYELFCFERWFLLQSFLRAQALDACLYLDSDVLLYSNATVEARRFVDVDLTPSQNSPHCMFISRRSAVDRFCAFLIECYTSREAFARLESDFLTLQKLKLPGGACDMSAIRLFGILGHGRVADLYTLREGGAFDHAMGDSNGFEMENGIKKIQWRGGLPHCRHQSDGELVRFHTLHFQGSAKRFLRPHVKLSSPRLKFIFQINRLLAECGKLLQKWAGDRQGMSLPHRNSPA